MRRGDLAAGALVAACAVAGPVFAQCEDPAGTPGRFVVRGVELVDMQTRLVWLRCAAGYVPGAQCDASAVLPAQTFESATTPVGGPGLPKGDWRLPSADEWETIIARGCKYLVEPKHIEIMFDKVWTSTPAGRDQVYAIELGAGRVAVPRKLASNDFAQAFYVRAAGAGDLSPGTIAATPAAEPVAAAYSKAELQKIYTDYLSAEGYGFEVTAAGNILFRREGRTYLAYVNEKDPTFFRLVLGFSYDDKSAQARAARLEAANFASEQTKVVKAYVPQDGSVMFAAEMFLVTPGDLRKAMPRTLRAIDFAHDKYRARLAELGKGG